MGAGILLPFLNTHILNRSNMLLSDLFLLAKKILIGIIVFLVPLAIIAGLLFLTQSIS